MALSINIASKVIRVANLSMAERNNQRILTTTLSMIIAANRATTGRQQN